MLESYVLRIRSDEAAAGRLVGEVEAVRTGRITTVRGVPDLLAAIRAGHESPNPPLVPSEEP